ncbi:DUF29 domain-containing protein [Methylobacterium phyllostachyos]|uniref:DUF29 domain-containing protein n=1 Tax=Methylobacterium phyllostachyos TaxID=582672 RepID=UPI001430DC5E|nr:DUF29 domain-containing protein [Methylobacterium phyllostachyos]
MGRSERHALTSALSLILLHLLKWDPQPSRQSRSWVTSIRTPRSLVEERLDDSPRPRSQIGGLVARACHRARLDATGETGVDEDTFPQVCPYSWEAIMTRSIPWPPADPQA